MAAALVRTDRPSPAEALGCENVGAWLEGLGLPAAEIELPLFEYAHDLVRYHLSILASNLEDRLARGSYREIADGVFAAEGAGLGEHCVVDHGPGRGDGRHASADVQAPQRDPASLRRAASCGHVRADAPRAAVGRGAAVVVIDTAVEAA